MGTTNLTTPLFPVGPVLFPFPGPIISGTTVLGGSLMLRTIWYGFVMYCFWTRGFDVFPSTGILLPLPSTTITTLGGAVSLMEDVSLDEEELSLLLAFLGVSSPPSYFVASWGDLPLLWSPYICVVALMLSASCNSTSISPNDCSLYIALLCPFLFPLVALYDPTSVPSSAWDFPRLSA